MQRPFSLIKHMTAATIENTSKGDNWKINLSSMVFLKKEKVSILYFKSRDTTELLHWGYPDHQTQLDHSQTHQFQRNSFINLPS
jgi:hypothetical protein